MSLGFVWPFVNIPRASLEYPTSDVSFAYLVAINKFELYRSTGGNLLISLVTSDDFTDKAISGWGRDGMRWQGRFDVDNDNGYVFVLRTPNLSMDFLVERWDAGSYTIIIWESVDLDDRGYLLKASISGSTIKWFRNDLSTPKAWTTDTTYTTGRYGVGNIANIASRVPVGALACKLEEPATQLPPAQRIFEVDVVGSGDRDDPIKPNFARQFGKHAKLGDVDKLAITWGGFDYKNEQTIVAVVTGDNPYKKGAILEQENNLKRKNLRVFKPPRDLSEAKHLHSLIRAEHPNMIAGVHNFAYQTIGDKNIEPLAVADFYDGFVQGVYKWKDLEKLPRWELEKTINMWTKRLERSSITSTEKDKHVKKLKKVLKA